MKSSHSILLFIPTFLTLLMGVVLLVVATPRLRAAFNQLPTGIAIKNLHKQQLLDPEMVLATIKTSQSSITLFNNPHDWQNLGELSLYYAEHNETKRSIYLNIARLALQESLRQSPANSDTWFTLAVVNNSLHKPADKIKDIIMMSIVTGPYQAHIVFPRLQLALTLFPEFGLEDLDELSHQIVTAWTLSPKRLIKLVTQNQNNINSTRKLLLDHYPQILNNIMTEIEKAH